MPRTPPRRACGLGRVRRTVGVPVAGAGSRLGPDRCACPFRPPWPERPWARSRNRRVPRGWNRGGTGSARARGFPRRAEAGNGPARARASPRRAEGRNGPGSLTSCVDEFLGDAPAPVLRPAATEAAGTPRPCAPGSGETPTRRVGGSRARIPARRTWTRALVAFPPTAQHTRQAPGFGSTSRGWIRRWIEGLLTRVARVGQGHGRVPARPARGPAWGRFRARAFEGGGPRGYSAPRARPRVPLVCRTPRARPGRMGRGPRPGEGLGFPSPSGPGVSRCVGPGPGGPFRLPCPGSSRTGGPAACTTG
ncbi:hypothetical protein OV450_6353 [Actinobacteria bacterium OV450]|nr:hypothetical protein OV450_6353 [Actinobacteria bacterium OV450]